MNSIRDASRIYLCRSVSSALRGLLDDVDAEFGLVDDGHLARAVQGGRLDDEVLHVAGLGSGGRLDDEL